MIHLRRLTAHNFKQLRSVDLTLPPRGRFLVQGLNEAGKSTLFEAVYFALFGEPLATETAGGRLDDVIAYGAEEAVVEVDLALAGGRTLRVMRRARRGRPNVWELDVVRGGDVEEIRANRAVNARVEAELGFDGEALLNTCFVEQKKLEKLEGMTLQQRESSLMRLLNLDRLLEVGERLKVRPLDRANVKRWGDRVELARLQAECPAIERRFSEVSREIARAELFDALGRALGDVAGLAELSATLAEARRREDALAARAATAEALAAAMARLREGQGAHAHLLEARAALARGRAELSAAVDARDSRLPEVVGRGQALARLRRRLEWLGEQSDARRALGDRLTGRDADLVRLAEDRAALNALRHDLVEARSGAREAHDRIQALEQDARAYDVRAALSEWVAAADARVEADRSPAALVETRSARAAAARRAVRELAGIAVLGAGVALTLAWLGWDRTGIGLAIGAAALALLWRAWVGMRRVGDLTLALGRLEGEAAVATREAGRLAAIEAAAAARLDAQNAVRPADRGRAALALAELDRRLGERPRTEVQDALGKARDRLARARVEVESLERREAELRANVGRVDGAALGRERDLWASRAGKLDRVLARRAPQLAELAAALGVPADASTIDGLIGELRAEVKALREMAGRAGALEGECAARDAAVARHEAEAREAWSVLSTLDGELPNLPGWSAGIDTADWEAAEGAVRTAYEAAGGDTVRRALAAASREAAELFGRRASAERALASAIEGLSARMRALDGPAALVRALAVGATRSVTPRDPGDHPPDMDADALRSALEQARIAFRSDGSDTTASLTADRDRLRARIDVVRHEMGRLERELGLQGEVIDLTQAEATYRDGSRDLAVREQATAIVEQARRNVVRRIMPSTLAHMRRLLPMLTQGRYFDAGLSDDYKIEVYDERALGWKKKNIFSGGTRDQLSLALRLAFALATLPEERGAAPSFLFLDEPLGAFDDERARALLGLLTEGEIAESFDQIFLISHVRVDPSLFDFHLVMAEGRVVESDLP